MKKNISMEELRRIQLDILDRIHQFCSENELRYSLGGGTLLGAIRHKGYIPWDDDIDIMMPRPDYETFLQKFDGQYENLKLQHYKNSSACMKTFAKVFDDRTVLIEKIQKTGIYVDVFPIDGLPSEDLLPLFIEELENQGRWLYRSTNIIGFDKNPWHLLKYIIRKLIDPSRSVIVERLEKFLTQYPFDSADYAGAIVGRYVEKEHMAASVFRHYVDVLFEGRSYKAISDFNAYLTKHYGDYMTLPPKDKQVSNHEYIAYWK